MKPFQLPEELDLAAFISKEAHDLKSPFNRILGFTKLVLKGMDGPLTEAQREDLTTAYNNSNYAFGLMSNLVDMARLGRGEKPFNPIQTDLARLAGQVAGQWNQQHPGRSLVFDYVLPAGEFSIHADEGLIRQAIGCAISYVAEHFEDGARVNLTVELTGNEISLQVICTGKFKYPAESDLTMLGYLLQQILKLHEGRVLRAEGDEQQATLFFAMPAA